MAKPFSKQETAAWAFASIFTGLLGFAVLRIWLRKRSEDPSRLRKQDALSTDPGLLKKGTTYERYETAPGHIYPRIRTFYSAHPQEAKLPIDIPLLVFMHGLGGSAAQFAPLLTSLVNTAPCLAIDLPGCGLSDFQPRETSAYTTVAFAELLATAIDRFRNKAVDQKVVLIGHSMGCSVAALLASSTSLVSRTELILGLVALCPRSTPPSAHDLVAIQRLNYIPAPLFDLMRLADRRGGLESASVRRVVGPGAEAETKRLQLRFNQQSKSAVFQKVLRGMRAQESATLARGEESLLGKRTWGGVQVPLCLIAAEDDRLAPPGEAEQITGWLTRERQASTSEQAGPETAARQPGIEDEDIAPDDLNHAEPEAKANHPTLTSASTTTTHATALKTTIFPSPASHSLLYAPASVRVLAGLLENFLAAHVDARLSPGWQLQHLTTSGKWDVKNLAKWQKIAPCSAPIAGVFRAMKTMREADDTHCPREFVRRFGVGRVEAGVAVVLDISHESPVYDPTGLEKDGVGYFKFPTVSKLPPATDEVERFFEVVDDLRRSDRLQRQRDEQAQPTVGVHCHYGFNRTGFFIVCYLVERLGYRLQDAIAEFAEKRPPGIKHEYFVNELFVRYAVKMERRGTVVG